MFSEFQGNIQIKKKKGGQEFGGWNQGSNQGWGQPVINSGWGQQESSGWSQNSQNGNGWGQSQQQGWGQSPQQQTGGWGQGQQQQGWGQNQQQGWGQNQQQSGGWNNQNQQGGNGWNSNQQPAQSGWNTPSQGTQNIFGNNLDGVNWIKHQANQNSFNFINVQQFDFQKALEAQIILVEPSPAKKTLQQLKKKGQKFLDDRFPPNNNSLFGQWKFKQDLKDVKWRKISQAFPKAQVFVSKPEPTDIKQGQLGDCYFLAGLAAIAERPDRIFNLFLLQEVNEQNYYSVKMLYKGKWMTIDVDEYIPFLYNSPAFSKSVESQLWVLILEKAWAKMYTSFMRIEAGYPEEPLHDLTGAPIKQIYIKKGNNNKEEEWNYLMKASQLEYAMVCSSNPGSDTNQSQSGVVQGHAYTLLCVVVLNFQGQQYRLVKLRNPWGKGQFKGKWSDYDPTWKSIDQNEKNRIGYSENKEDGIFFIGFDDFWAEYRSITIAEINDNASYIYKSHKDKNKEGCYFKIVIAREGQYSVQVDKTPERSFEDSRQQSYNYPRATVDLGILNGNNIQKLQGFTSNNRTTQQKYNLKAGTYIAKVLIDFDPQFETQFDVNLAIYAQFACTVNFATHQEAVLLAGKNVNWTGQAETTSNNTWNQLSAYGWDQGNSGSGSSNNNNTAGWGGNNNNSGWGTQGNTGNNSGWGTQGNTGNNSGWGTQGNTGNNSGWGAQGNTGNNSGWGAQENNNGSSGWNQPQTTNNQWGNNNGWQSGNNNNGW